MKKESLYFPILVQVSGVIYVLFLTLVVVNEGVMKISMKSLSHKLSEELLCTCLFVTEL